MTKKEVGATRPRAWAAFYRKFGHAPVRVVRVGKMWEAQG